MPNILLNGVDTVYNKIIYIGTNGSDTTGNGTQSSPYATYEKAYNNAVTDDIIWYLPGDYNIAKFVYNDTYCESVIYGNKKIVIYGQGAKIIVNNPTLTAARDSHLITLSNPDAKIIGFIFDWNLTTRTINYSRCLYAPYLPASNTTQAGKIYNCHFIIRSTTSFSYDNYINTLTNYNCQFDILTPVEAPYGGATAFDKCAFKGLSALGSGMSGTDNIYNISNFSVENNYNIYNNVYGVYSGLYRWGGIVINFTMDKNFINNTTDKIIMNILQLSPVGNIVIDYSSFTVKLNGIVIFNNIISSSTPQKINIPFTNAIFNSNNTLSIDMNGFRIAERIIYYEGDGLLNPITRDFKNTDWINKSNVALNPGTGISLTNQNRQGSVFTDISVYKKAEVKKVTVDGDNDKFITGNFVFKPNFVDTYFYKNVITRPPGSRFTAMNYQFSDILYMKECVELPGNTTMTDNNDNTATGMIANSTRTWLLASAEILSLYVKPSGNVRIDIYNSLNTIIYTNTINIATTMTINKSDICKIVITNIHGSSINLFTVSAIGGYDNKKFHLYSNPKYNIYSPINALMSKLVLEDLITPTKDLVKSKKMGNLSFINNPSKVVVKKASSSSNQTSSKIVRNKIDLANIPMRKIEVK